MSRLDKLRDMFGEGYDAYFMTSELNIRYISGVDYTDGFLLITRDRAYLLADSRYIEVAVKTADRQFEVMLLAGKRADVIKGLIPKGSAIAYEDNIMTCAELAALEADLPGYTFKAAGGLTEILRRVKDETEKQNIIKAQRITESAYNYILGIISTDLTEREVALELEYHMRKHGADGIAFDTIAVSGTASSLPHGVPSDKKLEKGFLTMDFGAKYNGYCADMTRTVCIGAPDDDMKRMYNTVLAAQTAAIEFIASGRKCSDCDKIARDIIDNAGYKGKFGHSLGHGVGLYIHEGIRLSASSGQTLREGNVVTVEPGIYIEGRYGVRIEDMLYVTENGNENLTKVDKKLLVL